MAVMSTTEYDYLPHIAVLSSARAKRVQYSSPTIKMHHSLEVSPPEIHHWQFSHPDFF
jgi:hypothetical protein